MADKAVPRGYSIYSTEEIKRAVELANTAGIRAAGKACKVPESTIRTWRKKCRDTPSWLEKRRIVRRRSGIPGTHLITVSDLSPFASSSPPASPASLSPSVSADNLQEYYKFGVFHALQFCLVMYPAMGVPDLVQKIQAAKDSLTESESREKNLETNSEQETKDQEPKKVTDEELD